jgi:hypothetical protein
MNVNNFSVKKTDGCNFAVYALPGCLRTRCPYDRALPALAALIGSSEFISVAEGK